MTMTKNLNLRIAGALLLVALLALLTGCGTGSQTKFLHKNADLGAVNRVAVLPFESLAADRASGDKVQKIFYLELLALDVFDVAEPGQVAKFTRGKDLGAMGPAEIQQLGKDLKVDGLFVGTVVEFSEERTGTTSTPNVSIQLRLIETQTGSTIWSTGQGRSGASMGTRLFGVGGQSVTDAARDIIRDELHTLLK